MKRILVLRNDKIGDLVLATPLLESLKKAGFFVGVLASPYAMPLLETDPAVDLVIPDGPGIVPAIRKHAFEDALVLWGNWRNAWMVFRAGIPRRVGAGARPFSFLFSRRLDLRRSEAAQSEAAYNLDFMAGLGPAVGGQDPKPRLCLAAHDKGEARRWLKARRLASPVMLHPGSRGSAQNWSPEKYAELGRSLKKRFKRSLLVTAGPGEEALAAETARACNAAAMQEALPLRTFAALCGEASLFVSASTGPMHLAAALGAPTLSLFPPIRSMSPRRWGPRGNLHAVLTPQGLGASAPEKGLNYVEAIPVAEAVAAAQFLLKDTHGA